MEFRIQIHCNRHINVIEEKIIVTNIKQEIKILDNIISIDNYDIFNVSFYTENLPTYTYTNEKISHEMGVFILNKVKNKVFDDYLLGKMLYFLYFR